MVFFFFKRGRAYEVAACLVGSGMCIGDRSEGGRFTLVFMCPPDQADGHADVELTYNWDGDDGLPSDSRHSVPYTHLTLPKTDSV